MMNIIQHHLSQRMSISYTTQVPLSHEPPLELAFVSARERDPFKLKYMSEITRDMVLRYEFINYSEFL